MNDTRQMKPDGHCLFSAIADQLNLHHAPATPFTPMGANASSNPFADPTARPLAGPHTFSSCRKSAAAYMRAHRADFLPYLPGEDDGGDGLMSEQEYARHCDLMEQTAEWGGEPEVREPVQFAPLLSRTERFWPSRVAFATRSMSSKPTRPKSRLATTTFSRLSMAVRSSSRITVPATAWANTTIVGDQINSLSLRTLTDPPLKRSDPGPLHQGQDSERGLQPRCDGMVVCIATSLLPDVIPAWPS